VSDEITTDDGMIRVPSAPMMVSFWSSGTVQKTTFSDDRWHGWIAVDTHHKWEASMLCCESCATSESSRLPIGTLSSRPSGYWINSISDSIENTGFILCRRMMVCVLMCALDRLCTSAALALPAHLVVNVAADCHTYLWFPSLSVWRFHLNPSLLQALIWAQVLALALALARWDRSRIASCNLSNRCLASV